MISSPEAPEKPRIVILISGTGSNMLAIADAVNKGDIDAEIACVISNRPNALGIQKADEMGIDTDVLDHTLYPERKDYDAALLGLIEQHQPDLLVLAGFMRILTPNFTRYFEGRMINIHPSLLPKYQGLNTHQRALDEGDEIHGVTVHFVTETLDDGPNAIQAIVPVYDGDDVASLKERVHQQEHVIYPIAVKWFCEGRLSMQHPHALLDGQILPDSGVQLDQRH